MCFVMQFSITAIFSARFLQHEENAKHKATAVNISFSRTQHCLWTKKLKTTICFWYPLWKHNMKFFYIQKAQAGFLQVPAAEITAFHTNTRLWWFVLGRTRNMSPTAQGQGWRALGCLVQDDKSGSAGKHKTHIKNKQHTQRAWHKHERVILKHCLFKETTIHHLRGYVQPQPNSCLLKETHQGAAL